MKEKTPAIRQILEEWEARQEKYEHSKKTLRDILDKHGLASTEFNAARVEFEMMKEEFDDFEKKNHAVISEYKRPESRSGVFARRPKTRCGQEDL